MTSFVRKALRIAPRVALGRKRLGDCPVCGRQTVFLETGTHLREDLRCIRCRSTERARALIHTLETEQPDWRERRLHEASPHGPASQKMSVESTSYTYSVYDESQDSQTQSSKLHQDLHDLSLPDDSIDIFVTQDVLEHVADPETALREIARVLVPGGIHLWTVPFHAGLATRKVAELNNGTLIHHEPPEYHGNPDAQSGSLVFTKWGDDLIDIVDGVANTETKAFSYSLPRLGLVGDQSIVFLSRKRL